MDNWGIELGQIGAQITALIAAIKWLAGRISKIEDMVDRKLNNGIKSELTDLKVAIADIKGQIRAMAPRKDDIEG